MDPSSIDDNKYLYTTENVYYNLSLKDLAKHSEDRDGFVRKEGNALIIDSGDVKGRLPEDKYVAETKYAKKNVWWQEQGSDNKKLKRSVWKLIKQNVCKDIEQKELFVVDGFYNHDHKHRLAVKLITTEASAAYFFKLISIAPTAEELVKFKPQWTMMHSPETQIERFEEYGLNSSRVIATNLKQRESVFAGTHYLTEINKVLLSIMSYYLSLNDIGVFYCAAAADEQSRSTIFFGLSGSGKATLALENNKNLITNEAVSWTESKGMYALESGITVKAGSFDRNDPSIAPALQNEMLVENPNVDSEGVIVFGRKDNSQSNTYITFPRDNFTHSIVNSANPNTIIFLVKDAKGVLPRVSKLTKGQAIYYFLSGYTSTSTGVEQGVNEPKPEFSSCYAQPFLLLNPVRYANILRHRLKHSDAKIYMINVGWIDGDCNTGRRVPVDETKVVVNYLLDKSESVVFNFARQKYFNFKSLVSIEDNDETLHLKNLWDDEDEFKKCYKSLAKEFVKNYRQFEADAFAVKYKDFGPVL